jgi:hypothetical protein
MKALKYEFLNFIFLNFFTFSYANAQTYVYHPFPDSSAMWRVDEIDSSFPLGSAYSFFEIYIDGDTIASNGMTYHKLYIEGDFYANTQNYFSEKFLFGVLWQDTSVKKVFYRETSSINCFTCDSLLYDFNMQIGDVLNNNIYFHQSGTPMTIYSIDSIFLNNGYRKRFNLVDLNMTPTGQFIIEGIGSSLGGFYQFEYFEQYRQLVCFEHNDSTIFPFNSGSCEPIIANENKIDSKNLRIELFPIPAKDEIHVICDELINDLKITDILGIQKNNFQYTINDNEIRIFNINLPSGNYVLNSNSINKSYKKLIIIIGDK